MVTKILKSNIFTFVMVFVATTLAGLLILAHMRHTILASIVKGQEDPFAVTREVESASTEQYAVAAAEQPVAAEQDNSGCSCPTCCMIN